MATFERSFLLSHFPGKSDDHELAAAIGLAEGAIAVVRFQMAAGGEVLFGTCESRDKINEYLSLGNSTVLWKR